MARAPIAAFIFATIACSAARADEPVLVHVSGDDDACPRPADVAALIAHIAPNLALADEEPRARAVWISDLGPRYRVSIDGVGRSFDDPARACAERAKASAVFAALVLAGRTPPTEEGPPPVRPVVRPRMPDLPSSPPTNVDVELDLVLDGTHTHGLGYAGAARLNLGRGSFSGSIGFLVGSGGMFGWHDQLDRLRVVRFVPDASLRLTKRLHSLELGGEIGISPFVTFATWSPSFWHDQSSDATVTFALRGAFSLRLWLSRRVGVHAGIQAYVAPLPIHLARVEEETSRTYYWLGGAIGIVLKAR